MAITKRGGTWQVCLYNESLPDGRLRKSFKTEALARSWELKAFNALAEGHSVSALEALAKEAPSTMRQLREHVEVRHWSGKKAYKSLSANARAVTEILGEDVAPADVTEDAVETLIEELIGQGNSGATINRKLAALSKMLTVAVKRGWIDRRPYWERQAEHVHRIRFVDEKTEEPRMLDYAKHCGLDDFHAFLVLGMDTGMRRNELLGLKHGAVTCDAQGKPLSVTVYGDQAKSKKPRTIPLTRRASALIKDRMRNHTGILNGLTYSHVRYAWERMEVALGLGDDPRFVPHSLRHTFCSRLVQRGVHLIAVKDLAGHSAITVTMRYASMSPQQHADAILTLDKEPNEQQPGSAASPDLAGGHSHLA